MAERKRRNVLVEGEKLRGAEKVKRIPCKGHPYRRIACQARLDTGQDSGFP